ncbi:carboxymuconolactone decarboxylase family protein [Duganella callida]|uniref:Carboxymuconolactone decarboxylase family protein n=1 Tax=Duganella callida TaxID=2561932 RepID=A0A4Y9SHA2_9BURK|nr:carboxymuconolactone decarboxylase family protein [Duganella callida]TFW24027.1 carboxymuconolactone decarboxylase family protein [Duganella callida]
MSNRLQWTKLAPEAYKGFGAVHEYVNSSLPAELVHLIYLRVSLINGCAYCIDMHTRDLLKCGVSTDKVALVPVWEEAPSLFSDKERAALAWAESVTRIPQSNVPDADYQKALAVLGEQELADVTVAVALMNAFNRFGVSMRMTPAAVK